MRSLCAPSDGKIRGRIQSTAVVPVYIYSSSSSTAAAVETHLRLLYRGMCIEHVKCKDEDFAFLLFENQNSIICHHVGGGR